VPAAAPSSVGRTAVSAPHRDIGLISRDRLTGGQRRPYNFTRNLYVLALFIAVLR
jgi:hypothetical protein